MPTDSHSTSVASPSWTAPEATTTAGIRPLIGAALVRIVVPLWVLAGAAFKLTTLNPNVLPRPVMGTVKWLAATTGNEFGPFLMMSYRSMVAVELVLIGVMFFVPRLARAAAIAILSLFCVILLVEMGGILTSSDFERKGFSALLEPCGCFGAASPPTILTFAVDAALLLAVLACAPAAVGRAIPRWPTSGVLAIASVVVGMGLAFGVPAKTFTAPPASESTGVADATPTDRPQATEPAAAWPPVPEKLKGTYFVDEQKVLGQRLEAQDLGALISRPLPGDLNKGRWHLVYYRKDCDHCHELLATHFGKELPAPTLAIELPDSTGAAHDMPCAKCSQHSLPKGPSYVVTAPLLMTIEDGVIVGITLDTDRKGAVEAVLNAGRPGVTSVPGGALVREASEPAKGAAPPSNAQGAAQSRPAPKPFPPMPAQLESFYAPEFEKWPGTRFDSDPFALLVQRPLPFDLNAGKVVVVYYRADCEHCHTLLADHFSAKLPAPTIAIAIPDSDPAAALDMPCDQCKLSTLPAGPIYVIETPVLVVLEDGVVKGWLGGSASEDPAAVEQLLGTAPPR